jgi:hypothetical protein
MFLVAKNEEVFLPNNSLVHGTKFDVQKLKQIKQDGILASEFSCGQYDAYDETFYMADFFKNVTGKPLSIKELLSCKKEGAMQYLPSNQKSATPTVAFIVNTCCKEAQNYLSLDLFSDSNSALYPFIDEEMFFSIERRKHLHQYNYKLGQASIPIGVPYSMLCGIIVDKTIQENNNNELDFLKQLFGEELCFFSTNGEVLHYPSLKKEAELEL